MVEKLKSAALRTQVIQSAYLLYEALAGFIADKTLPTQCIIEYIQNVEVAAQRVDLRGLQEFCHIIRQNLLFQNMPLAEGLYREIEQLPRFIMVYLYTPSSAVFYQNLINILRNGSWPLPLS